MNIDFPILEFDRLTLVSLNEVCALKIANVTHLSELPFYRDSYFSTTQTLEGFEVTRFRLENTADAEPVESIVTRLMPEDCHFRVADIRAIGNRNLGLRHVSSHEIANREKEQGMFLGCSLNISFHAAGDPTRRPKYQGLHLKTDEEIERQLPEYEKAIDEFIFTSIKNFDLDADDKGRLQQVLNSAKKTAFTVIDYRPDAHSCDSRSWGHGMGRFPKMNVRGENITVLRPLDVDNWEISEAGRQQYNYLFEDSLNFLVAHYRKRLLDHVRM